jgi:DNA-binding NtrC family response regulator
VLARELQPVIETALEIGRPAKEVLPGDRPGTSAGLVLHGKSKPMLEVLKRIGHFTDSSDAVLILGETGTGKELVARALHSNSKRKDKPFVALNCTAINETLLESELFGHEKGAFTGADKLRKGKIEYADGGTLFLDEIGDMPLHLQARLLRVLEYQEVERIGSNEPIKVTVRLLSATHHDVEAFVEEGKFRRDLFFRLNRVTLRLPPLRERLDDLPELVAYFLSRAAEAYGRSRPSVSPAALDRLGAHPWPGNVRELQNVVFAAFGLCRGPQILPDHIEFQGGATPPPCPAAKPAASGEDAVVAALRRAIESAWDANPKEGLLRHLSNHLEGELTRIAIERLGDNQSRIAEKLGVVWNTASKLIKTHGPK